MTRVFDQRRVARLENCVILASFDWRFAPLRMTRIFDQRRVAKRQKTASY